jgi:hypothetical protein
MKLEKVVKWMGFGCILAGAARMGMTPSGLIWGSDSTPELTFALIASILMGFTSINLFMAQARETKIFGFIAAFLLSVGNIFLASGFYGIFAYGDYPKPGTFYNMVDALSHLGLLLGTLILMIVTFRAKVFPRWYLAIFVLMLLSLGIPFLGDFFAFFWGLTYVAMGYTIFTGKYSKKTLKESSKVKKAEIV